MNFKKLAITGASAALILGSALPAFGHGPHHSSGRVDIDNDAHVHNNVTTQANTGFNDIGGGPGGSRRINTGNAEALSDVLNVVNSNNVDLCGCSGRVDIDNDAHVHNNVTTQANTGFNDIGGGPGGSRRINTGGAGAEGYVTNVVNTNVVN